jgi:hypothetical protein
MDKLIRYTGTTVLTLLVLTLGVLAMHGIIWIGVRGFGLMLNYPLEAFAMTSVLTLLMFIPWGGKPSGR